MITIFCDFSQFSAKNWLFSSIPMLRSFFQNLALFWVKNAKFFAKFFGENILNIITSVPGRSNPLARFVKIVATKSFVYKQLLKSICELTVAFRDQNIDIIV
jgi:hypothetical protein